MMGRRLTAGVGGVLVVVAVIAATAAGSSSFAPVISKPTTIPAIPVAGRAFSASFKVTRSDNGGPVMKAVMKADPSMAGRLLRHTESFRAGTARLTVHLPSNASGKPLKVKLTIRAGGGSATKVSVFRVSNVPSKASVSIGDASATEGNSGTTTLTFPVTLSTSSSRAVSVDYATSDGTASAASDYVAANGTLTFQPGQKSKTIAISIVADSAIEQDETFTVSLSSPVNAAIAKGTATGTIKNDDSAVAVTAGAYQGATVNGDYVFLTVRPDRTVTGFRVNNVTETCSPGGTLGGVIDWTDNVWGLTPDGSFTATGSWSGSNVQGDTEYTKWSAKVTGVFAGASVTGTLTINDELNYHGTHYVCSVLDKRWSAILKG
jgi:Calx-beta domain-containing protein